MRWWLPYRTSVCSYKTNCNGMIFFSSAVYHTTTFALSLSFSLPHSMYAKTEKEKRTIEQIVRSFWIVLKVKNLRKNTHTFVQKSNKKRRKSTAINFIIFFFFLFALPHFNVYFLRFQEREYAWQKKTGTIKLFPFSPKLFVIFQSHSVHRRKMEHNKNLEHLLLGEVIKWNKEMSKNATLPSK